MQSVIVFCNAALPWIGIGLFVAIVMSHDARKTQNKK